MGSVPRFDYNSVKQFLSTLFYPGDGFVDCRAIDPARKFGPRRNFISADALDEIASFIQKHHEFDLYFGIASRFNNIDGSLKACGTVRAIWCDSDFKTSSEGQIQRSLHHLPLKPSIIVRSGRGLHSYWLLISPYDLRQCPGRFKSVLRRLAYAVNGDLASAEPAHILRIPGTFNYKYTPPPVVSIEEFHPEFAYSFDIFEDVLPVEPVLNRTRTVAFSKRLPTLNPSTRIRRASLYLNRIPPAIEGQGGDLHTYRTACQIVRGFDLSADEALEVLRPWNDRCVPPWQERDLMKKIANALKYGTQPIGNRLEGRN